jgi:hypothetical protein
MTSVAIKKELDSYLPLLTGKQQALLLDMVKNILHIEPSKQRISLKQYNKELAVAEKQIAKGEYTTQEDLEKEIKTW